MNLPNQNNSITDWLFNPFLFWGGRKILWIGLAVIIIHLPIGYFLQARFDGAIDMHIVTSIGSAFRPLLDALIAWVSTFLCLYLAALIFKSPIRIIDIAGAAAVARIPILISVLPAKIFDPGIQDVNDLLNLQGSEMWTLAAVSVILLMFMIWFFVLLFNAYKVNSNLKGWKLITSFIVAVILAEIISKVALAYI